MTLVAGGIGPVCAGLGERAVVGRLRAAARRSRSGASAALLRAAIELAQLNAGWLILMVGGIVVPGPGVALGHAEASRFFFGFSASAAPVLMGAARVPRGGRRAPLPEALRPSWFILLVPPSLIYAQRPRAVPGLAASLENLYFLAVVLAGALLVYARGFLRWPFAPLLVGVYLPARCACLRRGALRAGPPFAPLARGRGG